MDYRQGGPLTSIDLIEECLTDIYRTRKASLRDKARITEKNIKKRSEQHTAVKHVSHFFDEDDSDEDTKVAAAPTKAPTRPAATTSSSGPASNPPTPRQSKFATIEDKENDAIAVAAYESFRAQLCNWYTKNPTKRLDDEHRAELADFLTEHYMCKQLDPLPPSRGVTSIRRQMCRVIEDFASTGELPKDFATWLAAQEPPQETSSVPAVPTVPLSLASEKSKAKLDTKERPLDVLRGKKSEMKKELDEKTLVEEKAEKPKEKMNEATKMMLERQRIKEQYEAYMKHTKNKLKSGSNESDQSKRDTESLGDKPNDAADASGAGGTSVPTEEEYEQHLAEIRSLISTIQDNKAK